MEMKTLQELRYTSTHEWIRIDRDIATVGITDYAQKHLGDIVFIELPKVGAVFKKEQDVGIIESSKAAEDILMPLSGKIVEVNERLIENPELINLSPFDQGWIFRLKIEGYNEVRSLLFENVYRKIIMEEL